ncbi:MAG: addiction module protein [Nitrospirae bacterium]|nr:addiction module protein [Nitrospirota bacterium]
MKEYSVREFIKGERSPFREWFRRLDSLAANKITTAIYRLQYGNFSNIKSVGGGVSEYKINGSSCKRVGKASGFYGREGITDKDLRVLKEAKNLA